MPALCSGMACNYVYADGTSIITGFTYDASTLELTIAGSDFVEPDMIEMGRLKCTVYSVTADSISCNLAEQLPAGSWFPVVTETMGQVKIDSSVEAEIVPLTVTSISPNTDLNPYGGDILTITGTNFPTKTDARYKLSILLGGKARCVPISISQS